MAKISIVRKHSKNESEVRQMADDLARELHSEYGLQSTWRGDTVHFERTGLSGSLALQPGEVKIELKTGMMMSAFSGTIERELKKALDKKLG